MVHHLKSLARERLVAARMTKRWVPRGTLRDAFYDPSCVWRGAAARGESGASACPTASPFVFAAVRHPFARLVSAYNFKRTHAPCRLWGEALQPRGSW